MTSKKYSIHKRRLESSEDLYLNVSLFKEFNNVDYVDISKQKDIQVISRQEINPYFIELGFFDNIKKNKVIIGLDLTPKRIEFIRKVRPEVSILYQYDDEIQSWFDKEGKEELPWGDITIDDIDKSDKTNNHIVSKTTIYPIDINN